jgi:hypothetical protein
MARPMATRCNWPPDSARGLRCEQRLHVEDARHRQHLLVALPPGHSRQAQAEAHVLGHGHVRVQGVALKHHGQPPFGGRNVLDGLAVDQHFALGDILQPGDHAQQRGFAGARRPHERHELAVGDGQVHAMNHLLLAEALAYVFQFDGRHRQSPPLT